MDPQKATTLYTYEFITPSDPMTFKAGDDKIAYATSILLGSGKAGTKRHEKGSEVSIPTMIAFSSDSNGCILDYLGMELETFVDAHLTEIADALLSFSYGSINSRQEYDDAIEAITDPEKLKEFKLKHEDRNRTSMNQFVKYAWNYGEGIKKKIAAGQ